MTSQNQNEQLQTPQEQRFLLLVQQALAGDDSALLPLILLRHSDLFPASFDINIYVAICEKAVQNGYQGAAVELADLFSDLASPVYNKEKAAFYHAKCAENGKPDME